MVFFFFLSSFSSLRFFLYLSRLLTRVLGRIHITFFVGIVGVVIGPSLAIESEPAHQPISSLADTSYPKQNQYFDSTNMAYVLELSNSKTNQNDGGDNSGGGDGRDDDDEDDNRNSNDSDNIRSNQKYVNVSSRDNRNFYNNNNNHNIGDDTDKMNNALNRGPFFDVSASKNVTALVGKTANLNCRIKNLGNKTVSKHVYLLVSTILAIYIDEQRKRRTHTATHTEREF